jgi:hypothetical protein
MRATIFAVLMATGLGLAGAGTASAAPAGLSSLRDTVLGQSNIQEAAYCRSVRRCWHARYSARRCEVRRVCR